MVRFQPTLPARGATGERAETQMDSAISTHAPRTGSDGCYGHRLHHRRGFQPTLPARGATTAKVLQAASGTFQPTLPARGATITARKMCLVGTISTHAPRTGSDSPPADSTHRRSSRFQPTLPARGATSPPADSHTAGAADFNPRSPHGERQKAEASACLRRISTHAPRTGSDMMCFTPPRRAGHFNPRSPHGERPPFVCKSSCA